MMTKPLIENAETVGAMLSTILPFIVVNIPLPYVLHYFLANIFGSIIALVLAKKGERGKLAPRIFLIGLVMGFFCSHGTMVFIGLTDPQDIQLGGFLYGLLGWYVIDLIRKNSDLVVKAYIARVRGN